MRTKRSVSAAIVATITAGLIAGSAASASALSSQEYGFVKRINAERSQRGKRILLVKDDLVSVARRHSARMAKKGDIWHNDNLPNEVSGWKLLGENVGMGGTVDGLHKAFMDSPGHRANILESDYNQIGVGVVVRGSMIYVTEVFTKRGSTAKKVVTRTVTTKPEPTRTVTREPRAERPEPRAQTRAPAPKPEPPVVPQPSTVDHLVRMSGFNAEDVDPATGVAAGL